MIASAFDFVIRLNGEDVTWAVVAVVCFLLLREL